jgi:hypothetical protein
MNKSKLQVGQRWLWGGRLLAEIIPHERDGFDNAIILDIKKSEQPTFGKNVGEKFHICEHLTVWEYLEGQDIPK